MPVPHSITAARQGPRWVASLCALACAVLATPTVHATRASGGPPVSEHFMGAAYDQEDGRLLYREEHWVVVEPQRMTRLVLYQCPNGAPFARKWVRGAIDDPAPDFEFEDRRNGMRQGVRTEGATREMYSQRSTAEPLRTAALSPRPNQIIDAGFDAYVRQHWNQLTASEDPVIAFLVPSRLRDYELEVDTGQRQYEGSRMLRLRLKLDAWYGFAAPSIQLLYDLEQRRLRLYEGLSDVRDAAGRSMRVRIEFAARDRQEGATPADQSRAAAQPLVSRCDG
ncbi:hypothetical protein ACILG0_12750 [Pseudomonadota bacterium AL_CKDN230030165-1A_HGKHYDSX7]